MPTPQDHGPKLESVHTPGGLRPEDQVHTVAPDQLVTTDTAGQYRVVRKPPLTLKRARQLLATGDYTITPGGLRPKSMIHLVEPDEIMRPDGARMKRFNTRTETFVEPPKPPRRQRNCRAWAADGSRTPRTPSQPRTSSSR